MREGNWEIKVDWGLMKYLRDFTGGPVAKTPHSQCRGPGPQSLGGELDPSWISSLSGNPVLNNHLKNHITTLMFTCSAQSQAGLLKG